MILVGDVVLSDDIKENFFVCDLEACKGACCVEGDSGAPLEDEETKILEDIYPLVKDYITAEGRQVIEAQGTWVIDADGDKVTPTLGANRECAYALYDERGILKCGIEQAYLDGKTSWKKPISCHLYPIRLTKYDQYDALNPLYVIWQGEDGRHGGSMRFLPTVGRTMVNEHFLHLTNGVRIESPLIWECTRYCLAPGAGPQVAAALILAGGEILQGFGLTHFVGVFDARMIRIYRRIGAEPEVLGWQGEGGSPDRCRALGAFARGGNTGCAQGQSRSAPIAGMVRALT